MNLDLTKWSPSQKSAIMARGENTLVSAGAGSGKTSVLVERVVFCLSQTPRLSLNELLVVTFTEAAAAEMRSRIGKRLSLLAEDAVEQGLDEEAAYLSHQLSLLETAQISTLHSFCMKIVKSNFLYLGIEPHFRMLDEGESTLMRTAILEGLLEERLRAPESEKTRTMMRRFHLSDQDRLRKLVFRIDAFSMSQENPEGWLHTVQYSYEQAAHQGFLELPWTQGFLGLVERSLAAVKEQLVSALQLATSDHELEKIKRHLTAMLEGITAAEEHLSNASLTDAAPAIAAAMALRWPRVQDHPLKQVVKDKRDLVRKQLSLLEEILGRGAKAFVEDIVGLTPAVTELVNLIIDFQRRYQVEKRRRGVLDFHDLEHYAYEVLMEEESGEAQRLRNQFAEVFVDEYQDTNPIQDAIVRAIARPPGNVFTVGDVKQSIYRFRMAEPKLFLRQYQSLGHDEPGQVIDLVENYRSRLEVVDIVNFFFQQIFTKAFGGIRYDEKTRMQAGAVYPPQAESVSIGGPVEFHLVSSEGMGHDEEDAKRGDEEDTKWGDEEDGMDGTSDWSAGAEDESELVDAQREALVVAQRILEWMGLVPGKARKYVWDASEQVYRPLQFRDIVILLRSTKGSMSRFLDVLEGFSIPTYGVTTSGFYGALEIRWLLAALTAIDNPRQELDLVALLRSPLIGLSDSELAMIRTASRANFWDAVVRFERETSVEFPEGASRSLPIRQAVHLKVRRFLTQLRTWRTLARRSGAEEVARRLIHDTDFLSYVAAMPFGAARKANIDLLLDSMRDYDKTSTEGVFGFVAEAKRRLAHQVDVGEARTLGENEDVVRLMTIHQSKGLEFPVVFVAGLGKQFNLGKTEQTFLLHRELGLGPQYIDSQSQRRWWTMPGLAIREAELSESLAEEARILYVALTRAKERLILVGSVKKLDKQLQRNWERIPQEGVELPYHTLMQARGFMEWLIPSVLRHPDAHGWRQGLIRATPPQLISTNSKLSVHCWNCPVGQPLPAYPERLLRSVGSLEPGCATLGQIRHQFQGFEDSMLLVDKVVENLEWTDTEAERLAVPGKISATELRRLWVAAAAPASQVEGQKPRGTAETLLEDPDFLEGKVSGRVSGVAFHAVMQHLDLRTPANPMLVARELERLMHERLISPEQFAAVDQEEVNAFLASELGKRLANAKRIWREQPFFHRLPLQAGARSRTNQDFVLVQGVIDCLAEEEANWLIVDYKTDHVLKRDVPQKVFEYQAQVAAYHEVVATLGGGKPVESYIYFVQPRMAVAMSPVDLARVFKHDGA